MNVASDRCKLLLVLLDQDYTDKLARVYYRKLVLDATHASEVLHVAARENFFAYIELKSPIQLECLCIGAT